MHSGEAPPTTVRISPPAVVRQRSQALFGRALKPQEWAEAIGAPEGAEMRVYAEGEQVRVFADHPLFAETMERRLFRAADGAVACRNERFTLHRWARRQGIGSGVFARQVEALRRLGVARIEAEIAGGPGSPYTGYLRWMLMGYDAPLTDEEQRRLAGAPGRGADATHAGHAARWSRVVDALRQWPGGDLRPIARQPP